MKKIRQKTDLICAANAICHIPDIPDLIKGIDYLLGKKGLFIFEEPYLGSMYEKTSYDQIYDEHIFLFSISSIKKIFDLFDFQLIDAIKQETHGGSMRYVLQRKSSKMVNRKIKFMLEKEKRNHIDSLKGAVDFKKKL